VGGGGGGFGGWCFVAVGFWVSGWGGGFWLVFLLVLWFLAALCGLWGLR